MQTIIANFTTFKHQYLADQLDAFVPDYFISLLKAKLETEEWAAGIIENYRVETPLTSKEKKAQKKSKKVDTLFDTQIVYTINGVDVTLSRNKEDHTTWLYDDIKSALLSLGEHLYNQDFEIATNTRAYIAEDPSEDTNFLYNYEEKGTIVIESAKLLSSTVFKKKYDMKNLTGEMGAGK